MDRTALKAPLRITYFHYLFDNDTALYHVQHFSEAARDAGHDVNVHALNLGNAAASQDKPAVHARLRSRLKPWLARYLHEPKELYWNLRYFSREYDILARERPDVAIVRDNHWSASYILAARRLRIPLVLEVNSPVAEMNLYRSEHAHLPYIPEILERWRIRHADATTAVSTPLKNTLVAAAGVPADRIAVVPNGVDVEQFSPQVAPDEEISNRFRGLPVVGFVGSFQAFHGPEALAQLALRLCERGHRVGFAFVGGGTGLEIVRRMTAPISDRVLFTGRIPHERVPRAVRAMSIGILPDTAYYCCPLKLLEWMASGVAIVAPAHDAIRELIEPGVHGELFKPGCVDALVTSVETLLTRPEYRRQVADKAAHHVRDSLTWRHNAERVIEVCHTAIARRRAVGNA